MRYQDQVVRQTQKALDDVCRSASATGADKLDWRPPGEARSVLAQMKEIAISASFFIPILAEGHLPDLARSQEAMQKIQSLEEAVEAARESTGEICRLIADFPDEKLEQEMTMPFGGGMVMTMADILGLHQWNMVYHLGQINQIQLMLGDREMH